MRYGTDEGLLDLAKGEIVDFQQLLEEILLLVHEDSVALDCEDEVCRARQIISRGTSAHKQVAVFEAAQLQGLTKDQATGEVVRFLIAATALGA